MMTFRLVGEFGGSDLRGVGEAVHHVGDAAVLEGFGDGFPAELNQLRPLWPRRCPRPHLVEAEKRSGLQHAAEYGLLAHQVGFHLRDEG